MSDDPIVKFPYFRTRQSLGLAATFESELDAGNPSTDSLRELLLRRRELIDQYTSSDGSVREIERQIVEKVARLAGDLCP